MRSVEIQAGDWPDDDRLLLVAGYVREALTAALRELSWPHGDVARSRDEAYTFRLAARREAEKLQRPRRLSGVNMTFEYAAACGEIRNAHEVAIALDPGAPEASPPLPLPESCPVRLRQVLDVGSDLAMALTLPVMGDC